MPDAVALARKDLASRLEVAEHDVDVVELTETVWPDTCLDVPSPELCAKGPTPGYRVAFRALQREYRYHTDVLASFRYAGPGDRPAR